MKCDGKRWIHFVVVDIWIKYSKSTAKGSRRITPAFWEQKNEQRFCIYYFCKQVFDRNKTLRKNVQTGVFVIGDQCLCKKHLLKLYHKASKISKVLFARVLLRLRDLKTHLAVLAVAIEELSMTVMAMIWTKMKVMTNLLRHIDLKI